MGLLKNSLFMMYGFEVKFKNTPPAIEIVEEKLKELTGLKDIELHMDKVSQVRHPLFPLFQEMIFAFFDTENSYFFYSDNNKHHYMIKAIIATLVKLGGQYDYPLPSWANQKWEEVKHMFDEVGFLKNKFLK
jgi:hypothetical protein